MNFLWEPMSPEEFATFEGLLGQQIVRVNSLFWSRVRPLFYRPLLPFLELAPREVAAPWLARIGGFQHAVPSNIASNSFLGLLLFEDAKSYALNQLDYNRKRQVKLAAKEFEIRPIADPAEFKASAYSVYLSFYERARYEYGSQRTSQPFFNQWAESLFKIPHIAILGGYRAGRLGGVSLSMLVGETLFYATFFCDTASLRLSLSDLMLHSVREAASKQPQVKQIFSGMHKGGNGLDDFYLLRGCKVVRKPARLKLNPLAAFALKTCLPRQYARLCGRSGIDIATPAEPKTTGSVIQPAVPSDP